MLLRSPCFAPIAPLPVLLGGCLTSLNSTVLMLLVAMILMVTYVPAIPMWSVELFYHRGRENVGSSDGQP